MFKLIANLKPIIQKYGNFKVVQYILKHHFLAITGILGLAGGIIFTMTLGQNLPAPNNQFSLPPSSPFKTSISGIGFVEANTRNIGVGSFTPGVVAEVYVTEGQIVKKDALLFRLDNRAALAEVNLRLKEVEVAASNLDVTHVTLAESEDSLSRGEKLNCGLAISQEELQKRRFAVQKLKARIKLQESQLEQSRAQLNLAAINLDKMTVKAPIDGLIMKVGIRVGESVTDNTKNTQGLIFMGNHTPLYLRVQIDENDGWRFNADARAYAYLKGNNHFGFPLKYVRLEPYAQQKQQLSGESTELIDTRIIEGVYRIEGDPQNIYIGQQLEVFIEAKHEP